MTAAGAVAVNRLQEPVADHRATVSVQLDNVLTRVRMRGRKEQDEPVVDLLTVGGFEFAKLSAARRRL